MTEFSEESRQGLPATDRLLGYVADLELEVDRLRRQGRFIEKRTTETLTRIMQFCNKNAVQEPLSNLAEVDNAARQLFEVVKDLHDSPGYHPVHDQVVAIAVRPLIEQVFRWQQRLTGAHEVALRLEMKIDHVEWFPVRLRHILDNLVANALRHRDMGGSEPCVVVGVQATEECYELTVSDNGVGPPPEEERRVLELFYRATPAKLEGFGAGLAVVRLLVEQSGGKLIARHREESRGSDFVLTLPKFDLRDYLE
jgi:signal transduction histidine kinase